MKLFCENIFIKKVVPRLADHDDIITPLLRGKHTIRPVLVGTDPV